jgi:hypothetical protein
MRARLNHVFPKRPSACACSIQGERRNDVKILPRPAEPPHVHAETTIKAPFCMQNIKDSHVRCPVGVQPSLCRAEKGILGPLPQLPHRHLSASPAPPPRFLSLVPFLMFVMMLEGTRGRGKRLDKKLGGVHALVCT